MTPLDHAMLGIATGLSVARFLTDVINLPWGRWFGRPTPTPAPQGEKGS